MTTLAMNEIDLMRTLITIVILIWCRDIPGIQIPLLLYISILRQFYLVIYKPYESKMNNVLSVFNEFLVSLYLYFLILLTDYN